MAAILRGRDPSGSTQDTRTTRDTSGGETEVGEHVDDHLLDGVDVGHGVGHTPTPLAGQGEDRVADQLPGPVVGDVAAPVGGHQLPSLGLDVDQDVGGRRRASEGDHVGMLEQQDVVVVVGLESPLQGEGVVVRDPAEPPDP